MSLLDRKGSARPFVNIAAARHLGGRRDREAARLLRVFNGSRDVQDAVTVLAIEDYESHTADDEPGPVQTPAAPGRFQAFLQWLLDNQDKIIGFIKQIIGLFSGAAAVVNGEMAELPTAERLGDKVRDKVKARRRRARPIGRRERAA